jgi:hypothetical protein
MTQAQSPMELCRAIMHDYEQQWTSAQGHARRHPLRIKMQQLEALMQRSPSEADLEQIFAEAAAGDDWELSLLCGDLEPRWRAAQAGQTAMDS